MPYWSVVCIWCHGKIADSLLECVPAAQHLIREYLLLCWKQPGGALACPYCGGGPAKRLQVAKGVLPADLALLIAAAIPDPVEQLAAGATPATSAISWPWAGDELRHRLQEARDALSSWQQAPVSN